MSASVLELLQITKVQRYVSIVVIFGKLGILLQ